MEENPYEPPLSPPVSPRRSLRQPFSTSLLTGLVVGFLLGVAAEMFLPHTSPYNGEGAPFAIGFGLAIGFAYACVRGLYERLLKD